MIVSKKDGSTCLRVDFRKLNRVTRFDAERVADAEDLSLLFQRKRAFIKISPDKLWNILEITKIKCYFNFFVGRGNGQPVPKVVLISDCFDK